MSNDVKLPQFRYNRRRKHYSYIFKRSKGKYYNLLLSSKPTEVKTREKRTVVYNNVSLTAHPNPNKSNEKQWIVPKVRKDKDFEKTFGKQLSWSFHPQDKWKIKKIKKGKWKQ